MSIWSSSRVLRVRAIALWTVRAVAVVLVCYGVYLILARLVFAFVVSPNPGFSNVQMWMGTAEDHGWVRGWPMVGVGLTLALLSRRLTRWMIGVPDSGCPCCGYSDRAPRVCSECGLDHGEPEDSATPPARP